MAEKASFALWLEESLRHHSPDIKDMLLQSGVDNDEELMLFLMKGGVAADGTAVALSDDVKLHLSVEMLKFMRQGTIKPSALLAQPLPHADVFSWSNSRCGSLRHEEPKVVEEWDCMPDGEPLPEVIKGFVDGSNDLFLQGSFPVRVPIGSTPSPIHVERAAEHAISQNILTPTLTLIGKHEAAAGKTLQWLHQPSTRDHRLSPVVTRLWDKSSGEVPQLSADHVLHCKKDGDGVGRHLVVLEAKGPGQLLPREEEAVPLVAAWEDQWHPCHSAARALLAQLYTYIWSYGTQYGILCNYHVTYLACCPLDDRTRLLVSPGIRATAPKDPPADSWDRIGTLGAVVWLCTRAVEGADSTPAPALPPGRSGGPGGGDDGGAAEDDDGILDAGVFHGSDSTFVPSGSGQGTSGGGTSAGGTSGGGTSAGGSSGGGAGRQCVAAPPAGPSAAVPHPQTLPRLFRMLSVSSVGAVALGRLGGHRAVVKLLGTGPDGMGAFHAEVAAYSALQRQQGQAVPRLLMAGDTGMNGVHLIATEEVSGMPLSELPQPLPAEVATAAVAALQQVHTEAPGLLHGDIRLSNFLLRTPAQPTAATTAAAGDTGGRGDREGGAWQGICSLQVTDSGGRAVAAAGGSTSRIGQGGVGGSGGGAPRVVVLDFGLSRLGRSREEQRAEVQQLRALVQMG